MKSETPLSDVLFAGLEESPIQREAMLRAQSGCHDLEIKLAQAKKELAEANAMLDWIDAYAREIVPQGSASNKTRMVIYEKGLAPSTVYGMTLRGCIRKAMSAE